MLQALFDFFLSLFVLDMNDSGGSLSDGYVLIQHLVNGGDYELVFGGTTPEYLAFICSIISLIFILVLCCLFIYKIIKLVGGLIR